MDHSITFARHFARLLWLLVNEPDNIEEQKASLRALVTVSRDGPVMLAREGDSLLANGQALGAAGAGIRELAEQLARHHVRVIAAQVAARPADLLTAARLLAGPPEASRLDERLRAADSQTVHFIVVTPDATAPERPAGAPGDAPRDTPAETSPALIGDFELLDSSAAIEPAPELSPPPEAPAPKAPDPRTTSGAFPAVGGTLFDHFTATAGARHDVLLGELARQPDHAIGGTLAGIAQEAEQAVRGGDGRTLLTILLGVLEREERAGEVARREIALVRRRIMTPHGLRLVAALVPRRTAPREEVVRVLSQTGDDGADAVIELLTQAEAATDRRAYFDLLRELRAGVPTLLHMLGDDRWFVVRNAVDLLGELGRTEAEKPIAALLDHADERVRQSAMVALMRLDTPSGRAAVTAAMRSSSAERRQLAVHALGERTDTRTASALLRALDVEEDDAVRRTICSALGRLGTDDAVQRLIDTAEPASGLFRRKPTALRTAAVLALGEAATPAAVDALRKLVDDRDREVRDAALRALAQARRGSEPRVSGLFERPAT